MCEPYDLVFRRFGVYTERVAWEESLRTTLADFSIGKTIFHANHPVRNEGIGEVF
jgi:hypothetical protein